MSGRGGPDPAQHALEFWARACNGLRLYAARWWCADALSRRVSAPH
ncbi:hypothetical protein OOK13_10310 [Streptomyces sp. NBC_00378]|nr:MULTISPECIES: hypothetical protein [unclassified Streptomyces]MCX5108922.1 hypothetical protein [Streptomyces sp. NBC_00378]